MARHFVLLAALGGSIVAQSPAAAQDTGSRMTRDYVAAAGQSDQFEILEGRTALAQSSDPAVRSFAQKMIDDHMASTAKLSQATIQAGLKPPPKAIGSDQAQMLGALQSLRGSEFDKAYWKQQALAHRSALVTQQGYAAGGDVPALRRVATETVPLVTAHLAMAEKMQPPQP